MAQNKKNILDKKIPFNFSVRTVIKIEFEKKCEEFAIDKNAVIESLINDWLKNLNPKLKKNK